MPSSTSSISPRVAFVALLLFALMSAADTVDGVPFKAFVPHEIFSPSDSGLDSPLVMAVSSEAQWQHLWNRVEPRMSRDVEQRTPHSLPKIDFAKYTLLVIAIGSRPSGGFEVVFDSVRQFPSEIQVTAYERTPGADCVVTTAVTHPVAYALIPRTAKPVRFDVRKVAIAC